MNYTDEDGMKLASYYKRANVSLKVNQKIAKNVDISLDTRYTNTKKMGMKELEMAVVPFCHLPTVFVLLQLKIFWAI